MSTGAVWALAFVVLLNTVFIAAIAVALFVLNGRIEQLLASADPLIARAETVLSKLEALTSHTGERVNTILDHTDHLVENVTNKVETTTSIAEETIARPLISMASMMAGLGRGWEAYRAELAKEKGDGRE